MSREHSVEERVCDISEKAQFALLLDILTPKPGNVHRYQDHPDTRIIHFAASITQLGYPLLKAAEWGFQSPHIKDESSRLGSLVKQAVQAAIEPHEKNTLLGSILLLVPLAVAAGFVIATTKITKTNLRQRLSQILKKTTVEDAVNLIRALQIANPGGAKPKSPEWTSKSQALDYQSPRTIKLIRQKMYTLLDLQKLAASYDTIAQEYTSDFALIFDTLYPQLLKALNRYSRLEDAILFSYLWLLSNQPDTLIQRKAGSQIAQEVMERAKKVYTRIEKIPASRWNEQLAPFDDFLRSQGSKLNPGTTADLVSGALFVALLLENVKFIY